MSRPPRYAVVATNLHVAEQYIEAFDLDPDLWEAWAIGQSVAGRGFDRVVFIRPHWGYRVEDLEREVMHWRSRLYQNAQFKLI